MYLTTSFKEITISKNNKRDNCSITTTLLSQSGQPSIPFMTSSKIQHIINLLIRQYKNTCPPLVSRQVFFN